MRNLAQQTKTGFETAVTRRNTYSSIANIKYNTLGQMRNVNIGTSQEKGEEGERWNGQNRLSFPVA